MNRTHRTPIRALSVATLALGLVLAGCGSDGKDATPADEPTSSTTAAPEAEGLEVTDAWARKSPMATTMGAVYLKVTSPVDDALVGASVPAEVAATAELHETVVSDDPEMGEGMDGEGMDGEGMGAMTMQEVESIELPAGETVSLEPGGYHVMLIDVAEPLEVGQTFEVTLDFEQAADQTITVEVREG